MFSCLLCHGHIKELLVSSDNLLISEHGGRSRSISRSSSASCSLAPGEGTWDKIQIRHSDRRVGLLQCCCRIFLVYFLFFLTMFDIFCRAWDMSKFLNIQCRISRIKYPAFAKKWINIRKSYGNFYKVCCAGLKWANCGFNPVLNTCVM